MSCQSSVLGALPAWIINDWPRLLPQQALGAGLGLPLGGLLPSGLEEAGCIASLLHPQGGRTKFCLLCCHKFSLKEGKVWARGWVPCTRHSDRGQVIGCGTSAGEHMVLPRGRSRDPFFPRGFVKGQNCHWQQRTVILSVPMGQGAMGAACCMCVQLLHLLLTWT